MNPQPNHRFERILVTGAHGFLGRHLLPRLRAAFAAEFFTPTRADADLRDRAAVDALWRATRPDCVVHLAALCGGIADNRTRPADYLHDNAAMNLHVFEAARHAGTAKLVTFVGSCAYPAQAESPLHEDRIWDGYPQVENAGYSMAKRLLLVQAWAYRVQYGLNALALIPGNLYGEWDNFSATQAHVIPALLRKYREAEERGANTITAWGTGRPTRDFVYAGDVADVVTRLTATYESSEPLNISTGRRTSIRELAETIKRVTGFRGAIEWDTGKPDGQMDKILDTRRLAALGFACPTSLEDGLRRTFNWFLEARATHQVRL